VRADLLSTKPSLVGIQESKLQSVSPVTAASFLPQPLHAFDIVDSLGASGGLVSAWDPNLFSPVGSVASRHSLSIDLVFSCDDTPFRFTNFYDPCDREGKALFLRNLAAHDPGDDITWIIAGDFNLTRDPADRNVQ
jgi:hypothetical protein